MPTYPDHQAQLISRRAICVTIIQTIEQQKETLLLHLPYGRVRHGLRITRIHFVALITREKAEYIM